jgi:hypothetical protein
MKSKSLPTAQRSKKARKLRTVLIFSAIAVALSFVTVALSRTPSKVSQKRYVATREIVRDKVTGQLRTPTPEETRVLVDQLKTLTNRSSEGLKATKHPNGMVSVNLEGRFGGVVLGRENADGTEVRCVFTMQEAVEFLGLEEAPSADQ